MGRPARDRWYRIVSFVALRAATATLLLPPGHADGCNKHNPIMSDRQGQDKPSSPMKHSKHNGISERKAAPITKTISNVTNKLVSPVRALAKSPRHKPQAEPSGDSVEDAQDPKARATSSLAAVPPPPPDTILPKMQVFLRDKPIRGASIADYCDAVWFEGGANAQPFFAPWLESCDKFNISVGGWEEESPTSPLSPSFVNPWDGETYDHAHRHLHNSAFGDRSEYRRRHSDTPPSCGGERPVHRIHYGAYERPFRRLLRGPSAMGRIQGWGGRAICFGRDVGYFQ